MEKNTSVDNELKMNKFDGTRSGTFLSWHILACGNTDLIFTLRILYNLHSF